MRLRDYATKCLHSACLPHKKTNEWRAYVFNLQLALTVIIIVTGAIPLIVPDYYTWRDLSSYPLYQVTHSADLVGIQSAMSICLCGSVPALLDLTIDYFTISTQMQTFKEPPTNTATRNPLLFDFRERLFILLSLSSILSAGIVMLSSHNQHHKEYVIAWVLASLWQCIGSAVASIGSCFPSDRLMSAPLATAFSSIYGVTWVTRLYGAVSPVSESPQITVLAAALSYIVFSLICIVGVLRFLYRRYGISITVWLKHGIISRKVLSRTIELPLDSRIESLLVDSYALLLIGLSSIVFLLRFTLADGFWLSYNYSYCLCAIAVVFVFAVLMTTIPNRISRIVLQKSQESLSEKRQFIRFVSHEIRSPLGSLAAAANLLIRSLKDQHVTEDFKELILDLQLCADSAINLLNDILDFEKVEAGLLALEYRFATIANVINNELRPLKLMARAHDVILTIREHPSCQQLDKNACLWIDAAKIMNQVVRNLVSNAIKFSPEGKNVILTYTYEQFNNGPHSIIHENILKDGPISQSVLEKAGSSLAAGSLVIEVLDTGVGIAHHNIPKMFGQFVQFDQNTLQGGGGSGLGLWICKAVVEKHGGLIEVESDGIGKGTRFWVTLPVFRHTVSHTAMDRSNPKVLELLPLIQPRCLDEEEEGHILQREPEPSTTLLQPYTSTVDSNVAAERCVDLPIDGSLSPSCDGNPKVTLERPNSGGGVGIHNPRRVHPTPLRIVNAEDEAQSVAPIYRDPSVNTLLKHDLALSDIPHGGLPLRLAVVDDSLMNRKFLRKLLLAEMASAGYTSPVIVDFSDGKKIVEFLKLNPSVPPFHCIFMDFIMVDMHGPETAHILRHEFQYQGLILGITGNVMLSDIQLFLTNGANEVFPKPVDITRIMATLKDIKLS